MTQKFMSDFSFSNIIIITLLKLPS